MNGMISPILKGNCASSLQRVGPSIGGDDTEFTSFGTYIRTLRQRAGLSLTKMSARVGVSVSHYHRIEDDEKAPLDATRWGPLIDIGANAAILATLEQRSRAYRTSQRRSRHLAQRTTIAPGLPGSASWQELPWEEDDWCWYAVSCHPDGLTIEQVGALTGYTSEGVRQIEVDALAKLAMEPEAVEGMEVIEDRESELAVWAAAYEREVIEASDGADAA